MSHSGTTTESGSVRPPILTGHENYAIWRTRIRLEALRTGLQEHLLAHARPPSPITPASDGSNAIAVRSRETTIHTWEREARKAAGLVSTYLGDGPLGEVAAIVEKDSFTAREILDALDKKYQQTNTALSSFYVLERLFATKYEDGASVQDHINDVRGMLRQLETCKVPLPEQLGAFLLLLSFPKTPEWELFRAPILAAVTDTNPLTFEQVEIRLQSHALGVETADAVANAVAAKAPRTPAASSSARSPRVKKQCLVHGACGHESKDCRDINKTCDNFKAKRDPQSAHRAEEGSVPDDLDDPGDSAHVVLSRATMMRLSAC